MAMPTDSRAGSEPYYYIRGTPSYILLLNRASFPHTVSSSSSAAEYFGDTRRKREGLAIMSGFVGDLSPKQEVALRKV